MQDMSCGWRKLRRWPAEERNLPPAERNLLDFVTTF